jgi:hypothetical protein
MKYMLLIYDDEHVWDTLSDDEREQVMAEYGRFTGQLKSTGQYVTGAQLQPAAAAASVRVRDGKRLLTDGPFAETREQLGGYYLVDAKDLDQAIALAEQIPSARFGTIEVRPVIEVPAPMTA